MTGYTTGDNNRLTSDGTYNYTYDDEGNRLTRTNISTSAVTEYTWDHRNRLVKVTDKNNVGTTTKVVEYEYDIFDRRVSRSVDTTSPFTMADSAIERYVYDDVTGVASPDRGNVVLDFSDPDGSGSSPQIISKRYLFGPAVDQILAQENVAEGINASERAYWPLGDHLGTVRDIALQNGTIQEHYQYDSYGSVSDGSLAYTRYLYTGREFDSAVGLQYHRLRWCDPVVGRWTSEDPAGFSGGDANLARYVENNSTNLVDPTGLRSQQVYMAPGVPAPLSEVVDPDVFAFVSSINHVPHSAADDGDLLDKMANLAAGFGNGVSFGATYKIGTALGIYEGIDPESGVFVVGDMAGTGVSMALTSGAGSGAQAANWAKNSVKYYKLLNKATGVAQNVNGALNGDLTGIAATAIGPKVNIGQALSIAKKMDKHHTIPKVLSGFADQALTAITKHVHKDLHKALNKALIKGMGMPTYGPNGSTAMWKQLFKSDPKSQKKAYKILKQVTAAIDKKYNQGGKLINDLKKNLVNKQFTQYPAPLKID